MSGDVRVETVTTRAQLEECWSVRLDVFVGEQAVPIEEEIDDLDLAPSTTHVLVVDAATGASLGTGRLLRPAESTTGPTGATGTEGASEPLHIGRMAVRREARGRRVGAAVMAALEAVALDEARAAGRASVTIELSAQERAMGFYAGLGYEVVSGESYLDAGIAHQDMARTLHA